MIETTVNRHQGRRQFYNRSDGVRIEGITPKLSATVKLDTPPNKKDTLEAIFSAFPYYSRDHFLNSWNPAKLRHDICKFRDKLLACCDHQPIDVTENPENSDPSPAPMPQTVMDTNLLEAGSEPEITDFLGNKTPPRTNYYQMAPDAILPKDTRVASGELDYLVEITHHLLPRVNTERTNTETHFFRGSMFMMMIAINYYTVRVLKGKKRDALIEIGRQETIKHILKVSDFILTFYDWIDGKVEKPPPVGAYRNWEG